MYSKHQVGYSAELQVAKYLIDNGYEIFWPGTGNGSIDLIASKDNQLFKVQIKAAYWMKRPSGCEYLQATTRKGCGTIREKNYDKSECDWIVIACKEGLWIIPIEDFPQVKTINLLKKQKHRASRKGVFDIDKYKKV